MAMCKSLIFVMYLLVALVALVEGQLKSLRKCCPKGQQIDQEMRTCIQYPGRQLSHEESEILDPPNDLKIHYWLHPALQFHKLQVFYTQSFNNFELDVVGRNVLPEASFLFRDFEGEVSPSLVGGERYCYDITPHPNSTHILIWTVKLKSIHKCCGSGERLNSRADACEVLPNGHQTNASEEIVGLPRGEEYLRWLPDHLSEYIIKIKYNVFKSGHLFNNIIPVDTHFSWEISSIQNNPGTIIIFSVKTTSGYINDATNLFCFDELADDKQQNRRVLLTATYNVKKCCNKNQELNVANGICETRSGEVEEEELKNEIVFFSNDNADVFWLPNSVNYNRISVEYGTLFKVIANPGSKAFLFNESMWYLQYSSQETLPTMILNYTELSGKEVAINTTSFCFDYLNGVGKIAVASIAKKQNLVRKCCYAGEILSSEGTCQKHKGADWSPGLSAAKSYYNQTVPEENMAIPLKYFCNSPFRIHSLNGNSSIEDFRTGNAEFGRRGGDLFCSEWQQSEDGVTEVVASCVFPGYLNLYETVIPLEAVSTVLLLVSAAAMAANGLMRGCDLRWALVCHALSLSLSSALQVASFYTWPPSKAECVPYMYATYFLMVAAHWWLAIIAFSIYYNLRQPSEPQVPLINDWLQYVKRLAPLCLVAWGGSCVLTLIAVLMHKNRDSARDSGFRIPSFLETRTCVFDTEFHLDSGSMPWIIPLSDPLGSVFYYFLPMWILLGLNVTFIVLAAIRIRSLRTNSPKTEVSDSPQMSACVPPQHLQNSLLYVKLLLTIAVAELMLEPVAWLSERRSTYSQALHTTQLATVQNEYLFASLAAIVSFIRAASVFGLSVRCLLQVEGMRERVSRGWVAARGLVQGNWGAAEGARGEGEAPRSLEGAGASAMRWWRAVWEWVRQEGERVRSGWSWLQGVVQGGRQTRRVHAENAVGPSQDVQLEEQNSNVVEGIQEQETTRN